MHIIKKSNENEMISEFLKMEIAPFGRHRDDLLTVLAEMELDEAIILNGDLSSEHENALRKELFKRFRGYPNDMLFIGFPTKIDWHWAVFGKDDKPNILYIEFDYWNELSNKTGSPFEVGKIILAGIEIHDVSNEMFINGARWLKDGNKFPPLIFLTDENKTHFVILEGHARMTAYGLVPELFNDLSVLLGICQKTELVKWECYPHEHSCRYV